MSSTTTTVSMKARSRSGKRGPTSASRPSANAVSVDIATPQPCADERPALNAQVDRDRDDHPGRAPPANGQGEAPPLAQLAEVELAPRLEADDEEEERHQAAVHPVAQVERDARRRRADRERRRPERLVGRRVDVHPDERGDGRGEQDGRAAGLGAQEVAQRRLQAPRPRRPSGEPRGPAARVTATDGGSPPTTESLTTRHVHGDITSWQAIRRA